MRDKSLFMNAKKYNLIFAGSFVIILFMVAFTNFTVDPLARIRYRKNIYLSSERELKPLLLQMKDWEGLLIGSSKVTYIQPEKVVPNLNILNAAFSSALPEEIYAFLHNNNPKVKWIALGLDYYMFNEYKYPYSRAAMKAEDTSAIMKYLISINTLDYSLTTIIKQLKGDIGKYTSSGARNAEKKVKKEESIEPSYENTLSFLKKNHFKNYSISKRRIEDLVKIKQWADSRGIALITWMNPYNKEVMALVDELFSKEAEKLGQEFEQIFDNYIDLRTAYPENIYYFKRDPYHFYPETGADFFKRYILPKIIQSVPLEVKK